MKTQWIQRLWIITIAALQGSWLYAVQRLLTLRADESNPPFYGCFSFYLLGFGFAQWSRSRNLRPILRHGLGWMVQLALFIIAAKLECYSRADWFDLAWCAALLQGLSQMTPLITPEKIILFTSAVCWLLGQRLASVRMDFKVSLSEFQFGFTILLGIFFIYSKMETAGTPLIPVPFIFFTSALLSIALARAGNGEGWTKGKFRRPWLGLLLLNILMVLAFGLLLALSANPDIIRQTTMLLKKLGLFVWKCILAVLMFIAGLFPDLKPHELPARELPALGMPRGQKPFFQIPENVRRIAGYVYMGIWLVLILLALRTIASQIFNWLQRAISGAPEVEIETLPGAFRKDLLRMLKKLGFWLARFYGQLKKRIQKFFHSVSADNDLLNVRQTYMQLLKLAHKSGIIRNDFQTPFEYQFDLIRWLPDARGEIEFITCQYVASRYSRQKPGEQTAKLVKQYWLQIKDTHVKNTRSFGGKTVWIRRKRI